MPRQRQITTHNSKGSPHGGSHFERLLQDKEVLSVLCLSGVIKDTDVQRSQHLFKGFHSYSVCGSNFNPGVVCFLWMTAV